MRLEWLDDILAVAQAGSFAEAADRRRLTQSAFSRRIQSIEAYVGVELFDRDHKPVQMRPTTEAQREQIQQLATRLRQLVEELRHGERQSQNRVVIASQHALTTSLTPGLVRDMQGGHMRGGHSDIHVRLRSANLDECIALLLSKQADLALVYKVPGEGPPMEADYIETIEVGTDRLVPVAAPAVAAGLAETGDLPTVAYPADVFFGSVFDRYIAPRIGAGFTLTPRVETALTLAAVELAGAGIGIAWVPQSLALRSVPAGNLTDLGHVLPGCDLVVTAVRLTGGSGAAGAAVWSFLEERTRRLGAPARADRPPGPDTIGHDPDGAPEGT
jgi:DNA-binding transcriptional LysR family regulator